MRPAPPAFLSGLISCCFLIARERATEVIQGSGAVSPGSPRRCAARDDEGTGDDRQGGRRSGTWRPFCGARSWPAFPSLLMNMAPKRGLLAPSSKGLHRRHCERPKGEKQSRAFRLWPWIASSAVPPRDDDGDKGFSGRSFPAWRGEKHRMTSGVGAGCGEGGCTLFGWGQGTRLKNWCEGGAERVVGSLSPRHSRSGHALHLDSRPGAGAGLR